LAAGSDPYGMGFIYLGAKYAEKRSLPIQIPGFQSL